MLGHDFVSTSRIFIMLTSHILNYINVLHYCKCCNRSYSRCPPFLHALRTDGIKVLVTWFLRGQTSDKFFQYKISQPSLFILDNRKWTTFYNKDDDGKLWVEAIIFTLLDAIATVDVLAASSNDVNFVETQTVHFAWLLNRRFVLRK